MNPNLLILSIFLIMRKRSETYLGSVVLGIVSALLSWPLSTWIWRYRVKRRRAAQQLERRARHNI